jgi:GT2 family glycosyltransferase
MPDTIATVLVTYNRQRLLADCLSALLGQTRLPDHIILIDNASTDSTAEWLREQGYTHHPRIDYLRLSENLGGAGGFHAGVQQGFNHGYDWLWLMDDDACPQPDALSQLLACQPQPQHLYGSAAIAPGDPQHRLCWPTTTPEGSCLECQSDLAYPLIEIQSLTFLGLFVHRQIVQQIGLPDATLFLAGDDIDYCARARQAGARLFLVSSSILYHPLPARRTITLAGRQFQHLILPPWKRYYDVRNRLLIARRHYGGQLWTDTLPGLLIRLIDSLRHDADRWQQLSAYMRGIHDGFRNRTGPRR